MAKIKFSNNRILMVGLSAVPTLFLLFAVSWLSRFQAAVPAYANLVSVGLVTDGPTVDDQSFNWLSYQGLLRAQSQLGVVGKVYTSTSSADYAPNLQKCVDDGNNLCISVGFLMADATLNEAASNSATKFAIVDALVQGYPANLRGITFAEDEAGYLAGTLAGKMTQNNVVGIVGGIAIPPVVRFATGYRNGAQCANPDATVIISYTGTFMDPELGAQVAQSMLAQQADVIFAVAASTGDGAILTATQSGAWGIGVDVDEYYTLFQTGTVPGSNRLLTSAVKRLDKAVYSTIADVVSGTFASGTVVYGLADSDVGLAPFHDAVASVSQVVQDEIKEVEQGIGRGAIDVNGPCYHRTLADPVLGGYFAYTDTHGSPTTLQIPATAVTETVALIYVPVLNITGTRTLASTGHAFELDAYRNGLWLSGFTVGVPITVTLHYTDADVNGLNETDLKLYFWDTGTGAWVDASTTCSPTSAYNRHPGENWLAVSICHLSQFALLGQHRVYVPLVRRN